MTVSGLDGVDPMRSAAVTSAAAGVTGSAVGVPGPDPSVPVTPPSRPAPRQPQGPGFENPELKSGLLSDNITPVQRDGLGRLSRLLRMQPRELLDSLRSGTGLGVLLAARRLMPSSLFGMFDKGLLIDAEA